MNRYSIHFKRVYDAAEAADGYRVLADRLWPRGIKKETLKHHSWCKEACPSNSLRKQYHSEEIDFETFAKHYFAELETAPQVLVPIMQLVRQGPVTLLSSVKEFEQSHLPVLKHAVLQSLRLEDQQADSTELSSPVCFGHDFNYWN